MSTTAIPNSTPAILYAEVFDLSFTLDSSAALWPGQEYTAIVHDCSASYQVSTAAMREIFKFYTNDLEMVEESYDALKFGINKGATLFTELTDFEPANALCLDSTKAIALQSDADQGTASKNMICHDFVRYLALSLFNNSNASDLFSNQKDLLQSIRTDAKAKWTQDVITDVLQDEDVAGGIDGSNPGDMLDRTNTAATNVSFRLFEQLIKLDPARFQDMSAGGFAMDEAANPGIYAIPFTDGDMISFRITLNPAEGQVLATKPLADPVDDAIPQRVYLVHLVCTPEADVTNPTVDNNEV
jgi:hypothetical protein